MNQVTLIGNLTSDPELKTAKNGDIQYTQFTLAVENRRAKEKVIDYLDVVAFGKKAEVITSYFTKGRKIIVLGKLKNSAFTSVEGAPQQRVSVVLEDFELVDFKRKKKVTEAETVAETIGA